MNLICANCGVCDEIIVADSSHSISEHAIYEAFEGETYYYVKGWLCVDCLPPEVREILFPLKHERTLH